RADLDSRQQLADDAGAVRQYPYRLDTGQTGKRITVTQVRLHARLAGTVVGIASINQKIARNAGQMLIAQGHRNSREDDTGEYPGHARTLGRFHGHDVLAPGTFDAGGGNTQAKAGNRVQSREWAKSDGHDAISPIEGGVQRQRGRHAAVRRVPALGCYCSTRMSESAAQTMLPWHCLYFLPEPQGQGSLRPTLGPSRVMGPAGAAAAGSPCGSSASFSTPGAASCLNCMRWASSSA